MDEEPLLGGSVSTVVRVGDTVRRTLDRWSPAVHALLQHLESVGFAGAPRFLGIDDEGGEILTWIEGKPATSPWPAALRSPQGLLDLARVLRDYHDAVASFAPDPNAEWWIGTRRLGPGEIVVHGDLGPWNTIWRDGRPVAFIDWDFAEPAPPLADLAELACFITPMRDDDHARQYGFDEPPDRRARLRVFCEAYGWPDIAAVLDEVERYWEEEIARTSTFGALGIHPWDRFLARDLPDREEVLLDWVRRNRFLLE